VIFWGSETYLLMPAAQMSLKSKYQLSSSHAKLNLLQSTRHVKWNKKNIEHIYSYTVTNLFSEF